MSRRTVRIVSWILSTLLPTLPVLAAGAPPAAGSAATARDSGFASLAGPIPIDPKGVVRVGDFVYGDVKLHYEAIRSDAGASGRLWNEGRLVAESQTDGVSARVVVGGVEVTSEAEIAARDAAILAAYAETDEAAAIRALATSLAEPLADAVKPDVLGISAIALVIGEGPGSERALVGGCFGCCGPGCWGCKLLGSCYTLACATHDGCVALKGHLDPACLKLLLVAIASYLKQCLHVI